MMKYVATPLVEFTYTCTIRKNDIEVEVGQYIGNFDETNLLQTGSTVEIGEIICIQVSIIIKR